MVASRSAPTPPFRLPPRYVVKELLGRGGMGEVYSALDQQEGRLVALKRLRTNSPEDRRRLEREAQHLSRVRHEGIVRLHDVGSTTEETFLTMEYVHGVSLAGFLDRSQPAIDEIRWLLSIAVHLLDALAHLHALGLLHRDLKPSNVMVVVDDADSPSGPQPIDLDQVIAVPPRVKLLDFGLAIERGAAGARAAASGTPLYMSPEQIEGQRSLDERADLYSLGGLLYHCVTRRPPFSRLTDAVSRRVRPRPLNELNPACPIAVSDLILKLLEKEPHHRPDSARETRERLLSLLDNSHQAQLDGPRLRQPAFTGRGAELHTLRNLLKAAARGKGTCIRLSGERGAGKTWLLEQSGLLSEALAEHGMEYIRARSTPAGRWGQGATGLLEDLEALIASDSSAHPDEVEMWLETVRDFTTPERPSTSREQVLDAAQNLVRWSTRKRAILLVFDAFEKADDFTLEFVERLTRALPTIRGAILVSYRTEAVAGEGGALAPWSKRVDDAGHPPPITVGYLTDEELTGLAQQMLRPERPLSSQVQETLLARAEGRPLLLSRWLRILWDRGALIEDQGVWTLAPDVSTQDATADLSWHARCSGLTPYEREVLGAAVVCEEAIQPGLLAAVLGPEHAKRADGLPATLRSLSSRGFLVAASEGYELPEDLHLTTIAELFPDDLRASWHRRIATCLREVFGDAGGSHLFRMGRHLAHAGDCQTAAKTLLQAARYATEHYANRQAIEGYERAIELSTEPSIQFTAAQERGELHGKTGDFARALADFQSALDVLPHLHSETSTQRARLEIGIQERIGWVLARQGNLDEALERFTEGLAGADKFQDLRALLLLRIGSILWQRQDATAARDHFRESGALYTEIGDFSQLAEVESNLGLVEKLEQKSEAAVEHFKRAREYAEKSGDITKLAGTLGNLGNLYRARGDDTRALEYLQLCRDARIRSGDRQGLAICLNNLAQVQSFRGEYGAAETATRSALETFEQIGDPKGTLIAACNLAAWLIPLGRFDEARTRLNQERPRAMDLRLPPIVAHIDWNVGLLLTALGSYTEAETVLRQGLRELPTEKPGAMRVRILCALSAVHIELENFESAQDSLREANEIAGELDLREEFADLTRLTARLHTNRGDPEEALALCLPRLEEERWDATGTALLHCETGRAYRERGPDWADRTEQHLARAVQSFERMASPHRHAEAQFEMGIYWRLCGEHEEAARLFETAAAQLAEVGADLRAQRFQQLGRAQ